MFFPGSPLQDTQVWRELGLKLEVSVKHASLWVNGREILGDSFLISHDMLAMTAVLPGIDAFLSQVLHEVDIPLPWVIRCQKIDCLFSRQHAAERNTLQRPTKTPVTPASKNVSMIALLSASAERCKAWSSVLADISLTKSSETIVVFGRVIKVIGVVIG